MSEKTNKSIAFIVLQYGAYTATKKCIESILRNINTTFFIVVVDNCSPDNSLNLLKENYSHRKEIIIIESSKNLGFANGNNLGFQYAKNHLEPDYIVMLNNDTELLDDRFVVEIDKEYNTSEFAVMGPMILTGDGKYISSPSRVGIWKEEDITKCIQIESIFLKLEKLNLGLIYDLYMKIKGIKKKPSASKIYNSSQRQENVELHGSFMIFSRKYIDLFDGLDDRTFMYSEEPILYLRLKKYGLLSVYNPRLVVYHAEDASTNGAHKKGKQKKIFYLKSHIQSCKTLLEVMKAQ